MIEIDSKQSQMPVTVHCVMNRPFFSFSYLWSLFFLSLVSRSLLISLLGATTRPSTIRNRQRLGFRFPRQVGPLGMDAERKQRDLILMFPSSITSLSPANSRISMSSKGFKGALSDLGIFD